MKPGQVVWQHYRWQTSGGRDGHEIRYARDRVRIVELLEDGDVAIVEPPRADPCPGVDMGFGPGRWLVEAHQLEPL